MSSVCAICRASHEPLQKVTKKGLKTLLDICQKKKELDVSIFLENSQQSNNDIFVHKCCRRSFTDKRKLVAKETKKETRKSSELFDVEINCLFCGKQCKSDIKNRSRKTWAQVSTIQLKEEIMKECTSRINLDPDNEWGISVMGKVQGCMDLVAGKARYHPVCWLFF